MTNLQFFPSNLRGRSPGILAWVVLSVFFLTMPLNWAAEPGDLPARVDACVQETMEAFDVPGAAVAVVMDGKIIYEKGYGVKHRVHGGPVDVQTLFRSGSIQKMMTAAAVLAQRDEGILDLDEPVTALIPELSFAGPYPAGEISVWNLLTHTGAVPDLAELNCGTDDGTLSAWAGDLDDVFLFAPAGSFWNYTNAGYSLAGLVAERAGGLPYRRLMRERVWDPAGMHQTFFSTAEALSYGNYSYGHEMDENGQAAIFAPDAFECWWSAPAGDAFTTAGDLTRWALTLMEGGGSVITPESAEELQSPQVSLHQLPGQFYGYGVFVEDWEGRRVLEHGGSIPGWSSNLMWIPEEKFAVAVTGNSKAAFSITTDCVLREALGIERPTLPDLSTDPKTWKRYQGFYLIRDQEGNQFPGAVVRRGNTLRLGVLDPETGKVEWLEGRQMYLDTFFVDLDGDGVWTSPLEEITFIETTGTQGQPAMWLRNRYYVGQRVALVRPNSKNPFPDWILRSKIFNPVMTDPGRVRAFPAPKH